MKFYKSLVICLAIVLTGVFLSGCAAIAGIFKAGMWTGVIVIVLVIAVIIYVISRFTKK